MGEVVIRNSETGETMIAPGRVELRETDLFECFCVALESGEFRQIAGALGNGRGGRCAWGVAREMVERVGIMAGAGVIDHVVIHSQFATIQQRAGELLGYEDMAEANDAGVSWEVLAPALRAARIEVERG